MVCFVTNRCWGRLGGFLGAIGGIAALILGLLLLLKLNLLGSCISSCLGICGGGKSGVDNGPEQRGEKQPSSAFDAHRRHGTDGRDDQWMHKSPGNSPQPIVNSPAVLMNNRNDQDECIRRQVADIMATVSASSVSLQGGENGLSTLQETDANQISKLRSPSPGSFVSSQSHLPQPVRSPDQSIYLAKAAGSSRRGVIVQNPLFEKRINGNS